MRAPQAGAGRYPPAEGAGMSQPRTDIEAFVALSLAKGVGPVVQRRVLEAFGSPGAALAAPESALMQVEGVGGAEARAIRETTSSSAAREELNLARELGVEILTWADDDYPVNLRHTHAPPLVLYVKGKLERTDALAIAVVGSRRCSHYGRVHATELASSLARAGFCIVSGLARGVDRAAHTAALKAKGRTIAVLGCGLSRVYPPEHKELADEIARNGAVVSELPLRTPPDARNFPPRNRIISGLSLGVVVVEAAGASGSLITARWAAEQGREVFAVPGPVDNPYSRGTHQLIRDGAKLVESARDIVGELGPLADTLTLPDGPELDDARAMGLTGRERQVHAVLDRTPRSIDEIVALSGLPPQVVASVLTVLQAKQLAKEFAGKRFARG